MILKQLFVVASFVTDSSKREVIQMDAKGRMQMGYRMPHYHNKIVNFHVVANKRMDSTKMN